MRELGNVIERAVVLAHDEILTSDDLATGIQKQAPRSTGSGLIPGAKLFAIEREAILRTIELMGGSTQQAADVLKISVRKIQYRLKEYEEADALARMAGPLPV